MQKEVIFIADDFGANSQVNAAVLRAHTDGALHGAALMMGQPGTAEAIQMARENPSLQIGWHLHLNDSQPVTVARWPWGKTAAVAGWSIGLRPGARALVSKELEAQWKLFCRTGLRCRFFSSHYHLHTHPVVYRRALRVLAGGFKGWIRMGRPMFFDPTPARNACSRLSGWLETRRRKNCPFRFSDTLWGIDRIERMDADEIAKLLPCLPNGRHEFMFHPRAIDDDHDTATLVRLRELLKKDVGGSGQI